jgi:outer membrane protein OmpU
VTYEDGPISVEAIYKETSGDVDSKLEGTYDVGNGFMMWAGLVSGGDDYYVAATQDLGGGAQLLVSYGYDNDESEEDEIGNPAIQEGATVEVTLAF